MSYVYGSPPFRGTAPKAGAKDPRLVDQRLTFNPSLQPDQAQIYNKNNSEYYNSVPFDQAVTDAAQTPANQSRLITDYTPYSFVGQLTSDPIILIPRNANRTDFKVSNLALSPFIYIWFTFGPPPNYQPINNPNATGFRLAGGDTFQQADGVCCIDDIYIFANPFLFPNNYQILGYEGVPPIGVN